MKSRLKKMNLDSIFSILDMIESTNSITIEKIGPISKLTVNQDIIDENEEKRNDIRTGYFFRLLLFIELEAKFFNYLKEKDTSLSKFLEHYNNIYSMSISSKKINEYTGKILGIDYKKTCINVEIRNGNTYRPVLFLVSYRSDYDIDSKRMYSDDEVLRLIESKEIIVRSNPLYKDYEDTQTDFICGIDDSTDLENERVVRFTLEHYPFIYEELRNTISDSRIDKDKARFREDRKNGLEDIIKYYDVIRLRHIEKANSIGEIEDMCLRKLYMLSSPSNNSR